MSNKNGIIILFLLPIFILPILNFYCFKWYKETDARLIYGLPIDTIAQKVIVVDKKTSLKNIYTSNAELISYLKELVSLDSEAINMQEDIRMQLRSFYIVIFTALVTTYLAKKRTQNLIFH